jgi:hypothetical protein
MTFWANVFLSKRPSGQMSSGQMTFWANVSWVNVLMGKLLIGKRLMNGNLMFYPGNAGYHLLFKYTSELNRVLLIFLHLFFFVSLSRRCCRRLLACHSSSPRLIKLMQLCEPAFLPACLPACVSTTISELNSSSRTQIY